MEANRNASNIWMAPTAGGAALQLTQSGHDSSPVWSPDGKTLAFLSSRGGESQVYLLSTEGGEAHPLTKLSAGADIVKWSPDGKMMRLLLPFIQIAKTTIATASATRKKKKAK